MAAQRSPSAGFTKWVVTLPPTLFLLAFFLAPALIVVAASLREPGEFGGLAPWPAHSADAYRFLFGDVIYVDIFARSFLVAALTTLICIVAAYPLAWLIARSPARRRDLLVLLVILPFASNFLVRIYVTGNEAAFLSTLEEYAVASAAAGRRRAISRAVG